MNNTATVSSKLTPAEVIAVLGRSKNMVYAWLKLGLPKSGAKRGSKRIKCTKRGRNYEVSPVDLDAFAVRWSESVNWSALPAERLEQLGVSS